MSDKPSRPPLLRDKHYDATSIFRPENLLREARRQKEVGAGPIPEVCVLDPDGDILKHLQKTRRAERNPNWACYHTHLFEFDLAGRRLGIIGQAVGASFAVLLAEQLFASGCSLLISITSAGQLVKAAPPPYFVLIDKALRDEGTSYHYLPPGDFVAAPRALLDSLQGAFENSNQPVVTGGTWTTDAPYRETQEAVRANTERGLLAVEMEAAALYAFAQACGRDVVCFAHVTNQMATLDGDFEKGHDAGSVDALDIIARTVAWVARRQM
jgi:uridine phosphorylase